MEKKNIKVRILPLHNIGGVGNAGDEVWMSEADAEIYVRDGYVEIVQPSAVSGQQSAVGSPSTVIGKTPLSAMDEDITIMKPRAKRVRK